MKIKDIMNHEVAYVSPETTVTQAAQLMQKHDVGSIPVCQGEHLIGIVTDRDIVVRNIAHGRDPHSTPVRDVMTSQVRMVNADMDLHQAAEIMAKSQVRRLPVVDKDRIVGIVSLGDLATQAKTDVELAKTLGLISTPSEPENL
ncbi:CBS domain-containing protein [Hydrogenispora ethanolica]|uniref:CBS domain-containing protein n=1 Tax=Hydrogenispora ethanolica TaxID=1082276 RepID=A0A4R1RE64_HYDET|nr:CBS domain-containing protein [Hydrogenispora ethanolica]TCL64198.1 CBS domain-containing protein [Hydrogenispora ethanolica]